MLTEDEQFTYDLLGNRTNVNLRGGTNEVYSLSNPNLNNEYTTIGGNSLTHDAAGNMTECNLDYTYEYDYENRLTSIEDDQQNLVAEYTYDALGRRIEKIAGGITTRYYYDGWRILSEVEGDTSRDFVYGNYLDEVLIMIVDDGQNQTDHYYAHDHLYSPAALIADDGTVEERYEYDAYGKPTIYNADFSQTYNESQYGNAYMFTGRRYDPETGNYHYRHRDLEPYLGRFLQHDPVEYIDVMNMYEFVKSNPIFYYDPLGLYRVWYGEDTTIISKYSISWREEKDNPKYFRSRQISHLCFKDIDWVGKAKIGEVQSPLGSRPDSIAIKIWHWINKYPGKLPGPQVLDWVNKFSKITTAVLAVDRWDSIGHFGASDIYWNTCPYKLTCEQCEKCIGSA